MELGIHAQQRNFFEQDDEFPGALKRTLDAYNDAARMAACTAKRAASDGTLARIRESQWWETVAQTLERCLQVAVDTEADFTMPTPPVFDVA